MKNQKLSISAWLQLGKQCIWEYLLCLPSAIERSFKARPKFHAVCPYCQWQEDLADFLVCGKKIK